MSRRDSKMDSAHVKATISYPLELHYIKGLFLEKQYRHCVAACQELSSLDEGEDSFEPLQRTFAQFYHALAHDELARSMHHYSQAKVSAFAETEKLYREVLEALPTSEQCTESLVGFAIDTDDEVFYESEPTSRESSFNSMPQNGAAHTVAKWASPPGVQSTYIRNNDSPMSSSSMASPGGTTSDYDDLESHASFAQIMNPNRIHNLPREYSSMSLIQTQQHRMSQGTMQTARSNALPQYHVPPRSTNISTASPQSMLPRLNTTSLSGSPVRKQLRTPSEHASPIDSPVSPLGPEDFDSDCSTISPVSPETPDFPTDIRRPAMEKESPQSFYYLELHLSAVREQLEGHITLLQEAKQRTLDMQLERSVARALPDAAVDSIDAGTEDKRLQQAQSYWSFRSDDLKLVDKRRRIAAGRERGWSRKRFDSTRYEALAERALSEL